MDSLLGGAGGSQKKNSCRIYNMSFKWNSIYPLRGVAGHFFNSPITPRSIRSLILSAHASRNVFNPAIILAL